MLHYRTRPLYTSRAARSLPESRLNYPVFLTSTREPADCPLPDHRTLHKLIRILTGHVDTTPSSSAPSCSTSKTTSPTARTARQLRALVPASLTPWITF